MEPSELKEELFKACSSWLHEKQNRLLKAVRDVQESLDSETKSSAGDKHETGRAMLQLEREKLGQQLAGIDDQIRLLNKLTPGNLTTEHDISGVARAGSVVYTSEANYFMSVSAGLLKIKGESFYAVSLQSPVGAVLLSKRAGDEFEFNGRNVKVIKILS